MIELNKDSKVTVKVYSNGKSQAIVDMAKKTLLYDTIRNCTDLVHTREKYPVGNSQEIELSLDVVVLTREEYLNLLEK